MTAPLFLQDRSQCMSYLTEVKGSVFDLRTSTQTVSHWRTSRYPEVLHVSHNDHIVVAVDGACLKNGQDGARSSYGVFWGHNNVLNTAVPVEGEGNHTNQVAELRACMRALLDVVHVRSLFEDQGIILSAVVIKSDSEYLVRGVTEWLPKWKRNGWKNSRGLDVANWEHFKAIERLTEDLERHKLTIKFWHVPRRNNRDADTMAKAVLRGAWNRGLGLLPPF
ncbi:hypothetical protein KXV68_006546 [Aspergillus fumigatus]|uniref:ribonuclease H n=2 Tax=Aspergillus fumigatus TaxID=746128 RepID=Q4WTA2_ASPFU|nr:ribonuclease H1, putative [Aspergillus fumigatus Af293]EDP56236.1 reverse transcriptase, RNaseH, putative [Aspergillus fumigatus A1163]KAH1304331.1 hypothetical protein KXX11_001111 [Aspergillus fumigatus]EAL90330.2 ribonuclease H1, putative [Aspergillus fumigatus Af293]KAH1370993.1 hypothetical protein KXX14_008910 [Aspergillus fumigatus]KAH1455622.1 hypothetical protein KXX58_001075 [Aspergillus fumigatus]